MSTSLKTNPEPLLFSDSARGIYIPQHFAQSINREYVTGGVEPEDWTSLEAGPDSENYWESWDQVLTNCVITDADGIVWTLHQDGDLWLIPQGMEWSEDQDCCVWPEDSEPDTPRRASHFS